MANENKKERSKFAALITYAVALVCLLVGFFVPLGVKGVDGMLAMQLPDVVTKALALKTPLLADGAAFSTPVPFLFFGITGTPEIDLAAWTVILYAAMTLIALILLIPACVSKKQSATCLKIAYAVEIISAVVLILYTLLVMTRYGAVSLNYAVFIALGGTLIALILQSFIYNKNGNGAAMRLILFVLAAVAVFMLFPISGIFSKSASKLADFSAKLKATPSAFYGVDGLTLLYFVFGSDLLKIALDIDVYNFLLVIFGTIACAFVVFNLLVELGALTHKTKSGRLMFGIWRYLLEMVFIALALIFTLLLEKDGASYGLFAFIILIIAFIQFVLYVARYIREASRKKREKPDSAKPASAAELERTANLYRSDEKRFVANNPAPPVIVNVSTPAAATAAQPQAQPAAAQSAAEPQPAPAPSQEGMVYTVKPIYDGPTDDFINTLSNEEKIEFAQVFLEKKKGTIAGIPSYRVGGDNKKFFSSVFIYFGRLHDLVSDGLMDKFFQADNKPNV